MRTPTQEPGLLTLSMRRTWLALCSAIEAELKPSGLSTAQFLVLLTIREMPGCSGAEVGRVTASSRQAVGEVLLRLERNGLIFRAPHSIDRRVQMLYLTELGRQILENARTLIALSEAKFGVNLNGASWYLAGDPRHAARSSGAHDEEGDA